MPDPRVKRTQAHVYKTVREMLDARDGSELTMNSLAATAEVSRRTLNLYWDSIEDVLAGTLMEPGFSEIFNDDDSVEERLRVFLNTIRLRIQRPISFTTMLALAGATKANPDATNDEKIYVLTRAWMHYFRARIGPITEEQYSHLIGPIFFQELWTPRPASDEMIEILVQLGLSIVGSVAHTSPASPAETAKA